MDMSDISKLLEQQGADFKAAQDKRDSEMTALRGAVDQLLLKGGRPNLGGGKDNKAATVEQWRDTKSGKLVPVLGHADSLAAIEGKGEAPNLGRQLRGLVLGSAAPDARELADEFKALGGTSDPAGGYTISGALSSQWIDLLRAQMVLSRAGARTVPMEARDVTLAKLTADPAVAWHKENGDLTATDPTFGAVNLRARTVVCLVRLSLELAQDAANLDSMLQTSVTNALAHAIDSAGLVGVTTDAAAAPDGIFTLTGRNTVTSIGAPTSWDFVVDGMYELMADNVAAESIGAMVAHPALWKKMRKLKTGIASDNTPLTMPAEVAALPKLWTTAAPLTGGTTAKAAIGDWRDLLFGVRRDITVQMLNQTFLGSNLQVAMLAYARVDFAATRAQSFCTLEGITV